MNIYFRVVPRRGGRQRAARVPGVLPVAAARALGRARGAAARAGRGGAEARGLRAGRARLLHARRAAAAAPPPASMDAGTHTISTYILHKLRVTLLVRDGLPKLLNRILHTSVVWSNLKDRNLIFFLGPVGFFSALSHGVLKVIGRQCQTSD